MTNVTRTEERVITLKEIVDTINVERVANGERKLEHGKQMYKVAGLATESSFGGIDILSIPTYNPDGSFNNTVATYSLTKKQAIAVGAKLDNKRLILIVDKLEELSQPKAVKQMTQMEMIAAMAQQGVETERRLTENENAIAALPTIIEDDIVPKVLDEKLDERFDKRPSAGYMSLKDLQSRYGMSATIMRRVLDTMEDITTEACYKTVERVGIVNYTGYLVSDVDVVIHAVMKTATKVTKLFWESDLFQGRFKITNKKFIPKTNKKVL